MPEPSQGHFEKSENTSHTPPIDNEYVSLHDLIKQEEVPKKSSFTWLMRYVYTLFKSIFFSHNTEKTDPHNLSGMFNPSNHSIIHSSLLLFNKYKAQHEKYKEKKDKEPPPMKNSK